MFLCLAQTVSFNTLQLRPQLMTHVRIWKHFLLTCGWICVYIISIRLLQLLLLQTKNVPSSTAYDALYPYTEAMDLKDFNFVDYKQMHNYILISLKMENKRVQQQHCPKIHFCIQEGAKQKYAEQSELQQVNFKGVMFAICII